MAHIKKRRRVKKKGAKKNLYFHQGTQDAIIEYQNCENRNEKEKIYVTQILPAFVQLTESLIFIHGFAKGLDFDSLKNDCVTHLYETIGKWDPERGTKAFSYFNVVAKHYLIIQTKKHKKNTRYISLDDESSLNYTEKKMVENHQVLPGPDDILIELAQSDEIQKLLVEIRGRVSKENEIRCIDAILEIFEKVDELDFLNKRAIFVYLREISGLTPKKLSIAMSVIRKHYRELARSDDFGIF